MRTELSACALAVLTSSCMFGVRVTAETGRGSVERPTSSDEASSDSTALMLDAGGRRGPDLQYWVNYGLVLSTVRARDAMATQAFAADTGVADRLSGSLTYRLLERHPVRAAVYGEFGHALIFSDGIGFSGPAMTIEGGGEAALTTSSGGFWRARVGVFRESGRFDDSADYATLGLLFSVGRYWSIER